MAYIVSLSAALLGVLLLVPTLFGEFTAYQIGLFLIYAIAGQGIGYLWGRTGILPFGQAAFFGLSAYACAHILMTVESLSLQILCLLLVILVAGFIAFVLASVVFKGRTDSGPFFSLITLALAMIAEQIAGTATQITGGFNGLSGFSPIGNLDQFGSLYYLIVAGVIVSTVVLLTLDRLPVGLLARSIADNEKRLQLFGFPTHVIKGLIFALAAALAALAGILFANHQGIVTPTSSGFMLSANLVIWTAVGGRYHILGPIIGAVGIGYLSSELRGSFVYWELILALVFILVVLKAPGGVAQFIHQFAKRFLPSNTKDVQSISEIPPSHVEAAPESLVFSGSRVQMGPVKILNGVDLITPKQGIVCIIGPNGAGKTSLLNVITGGLPLIEGELKYGIHPIHNRPPYTAMKMGIARKLQVPSVFSSMSVAENLSVAMLAGRANMTDFFKPSALRWRSVGLSNLLSTPGLPLLTSMNHLVSDLPQGHRQFLEFAMTTASDSRLLLLDEPCAGLSPAETKLMTDIVSQYQKDNQGLVMLIEHDMSIVRSLADHVVVMHQGKVLAEGSYDDVRENEAVKDVYAGGTK